jgi:two-component system, response regulator / RNA-binding antiterminator
MTRRPRQNFSGSRALLFYGPDQNRDVLAQTLVRLGLHVETLEPGTARAATCAALRRVDVFVFDSDCAESPPLSRQSTTPIPVIAAVGLETPSRLHRTFELGANAILHKPIRSSGIYSALFFAFNQHRQLVELGDRLSDLQARHSARRFVQKAVLRLMEENACGDEEAYRLLRKESMRLRLTVEEFAVRVLADGLRRAGGKA